MTLYKRWHWAKNERTKSCFSNRTSPRSALYKRSKTSRHCKFRWRWISRIEGQSRVRQMLTHSSTTTLRIVARTNVSTQVRRSRRLISAFASLKMRRLYSCRICQYLTHSSVRHQDRPNSRNFNIYRRRVSNGCKNPQLVLGSPRVVRRCHRNRTLRISCSTPRRFKFCTKSSSLNSWPRYNARRRTKRASASIKSNWWRLTRYSHSREVANRNEFSKNKRSNHFTRLLPLSCTLRSTFHRRLSLKQ